MIPPTVGLSRTWSYGLVLYVDAFDNLLFFAAWPIPAACIALPLLRQFDTILNVDALRTVSRP